MPDIANDSTNVADSNAIDEEQARINDIVLLPYP